MDKKAIDFLGNEIHVGDEVVHIQKGYRTLVKSEVISVAPKMVTVSRKTERGDSTYRTFHSDVVVIPKPCSTGQHG